MNDTRQAACYEQRGAVALITLNRPEALNSFDAALRLQLAAALQRAAADAAVRALVLTGAGRAFSAGADLKAMGAGKADGDEVSRQLNDEYGTGIRAIIDMPKPVIAAVEGLVAGIGCAFVLASDLVVMAEDSYFTLPFHNIGLVPDGGINWLLERQLGARRAYEFSVDCTRVAAARCLELGLANRVVAKGAAVETALQWAERLAQRAPLALQHSKRLLREAGRVSFDESYRSEVGAQSQCINSGDFREGVAAFLAKREPRFTGR
ncbi:MAG: enoyl-CoA hydratase/isomerase family protein [Proteobacteria bacterium]|nr:enoyl-CoA hydratase/isomerase family protein [Pseudomonadota bacterium]